MYECESWTIEKAECWRIAAFELWCWRRLLRVPWTARRSNQSILNEISPEYSLEGLMLRLKLQYFGHLMRKTDSLEKTLMLGNVEDKRWKRWQRMRWLDGLTDSTGDEFEQALEDDRQESQACRNPWGHKESDTTARPNWTDPDTRRPPFFSLLLYFVTSISTGTLYILLSVIMNFHSLRAYLYIFLLIVGKIC